MSDIHDVCNVCGVDGYYTALHNNGVCTICNQNYDHFVDYIKAIDNCPICDGKLEQNNPKLKLKFCDNCKMDMRWSAHSGAISFNIDEVYYYLMFNRAINSATEVFNTHYVYFFIHNKEEIPVQLKSTYNYLHEIKKLKVLL